MQPAPQKEIEMYFELIPNHINIFKMPLAIYGKYSEWLRGHCFYSIGKQREFMKEGIPTIVSCTATEVILKPDTRKSNKHICKELKQYIIL